MSEESEEQKAERHPPPITILMASIITVCHPTHMLATCSACLYVCVCAWCVCVRACVCVCLRPHAYDVHMGVCTYVLFVYICEGRKDNRLSLCTGTHVFLCVCVRVCLCMCVCVCVCVCVSSRRALGAAGSVHVIVYTEHI